MEELGGDTPEIYDCEIRLVSFFKILHTSMGMIKRKRKLMTCKILREIAEGESSKAKGKGLHRLWCWVWR